MNIVRRSKRCRLAMQKNIINRPRYFGRYRARTQFTMAYTPQQNGVAERRTRTSMEHVSAHFFDCNLPRVLWAVCIRQVTDLLNMTPSVSTNQRTPYEPWHNRKPTVIHLRVFGCKAPIHVPKNGETSWIPVQPPSCTWAYLIRTWFLPDECQHMKHCVQPRCYI
jgi:hypothetical protein